MGTHGRAGKTGWKMVAREKGFILEMKQER